MGDLEVSIHKASSALRAVCDSRVFGSLWSPEQAAKATSELNGCVLSGKLRDVAGTISTLTELLKGKHEVLQLFVHATCVKWLSKELQEDEDLSSSDDEEDEEDEPDSALENPRQTPADGTGAGSHPFEGLDANKIADKLLVLLKEENSGLRFKFKDLATKLGAAGMWSLLKETNDHIQQGGPHTIVASGERPRTAGGVFLKVAKAKEAELKHQSALQVAANMDFKLRNYQQQAVDTISTRGGNWVVAAPTNTGKTAIFIELSKRVLAAHPGGTVVVVVPTVSLVYQQCCAYLTAGFRPASGPTDLGQEVPAVDWFCGDKQLLSGMWRQEVQRLGVIVIEAQSFANLVTSGTASLAHIHMLVLDECHHTFKDHPYARIMQSYPTLSKKPQVVGVSASPANGKNEAALENKLTQLLSLLEAQLYVVGEDEPMVQTVAPAPKEQEVRMKARSVDGQMQEWFRHLMHLLSLDVSAALAAELSKPGVPPASVAEANRLVGEVPSVVTLSVNPMAAYNDLCRWMNDAMLLARFWSLPNLAACVQVMEVLRRAEALCNDLGYECALQYLAQRAVSISSRMIGPAGSTITSRPKYVPAKRTWLKDLPDIGHASSDVEMTDFDQQLSALYQHLNTAPSPDQIRQQQLDQIPLTKLKPCGDIGLSPGRLCRLLVDQLSVWDGAASPLKGWSKRVPGQGNPVTSLDPPPPSVHQHSKQLVQTALLPLLPGGLTSSCQPKLLELVHYLQRYRDKSEFHGIIFCRSRQCAHYLVEVLRAACLPALHTALHLAAGSIPRHGTSPLHFIDDISLFVGHGSRVDDKSRSVTGTGINGLVGANEGLAARGMNVTQQCRALEQFKKPGRRLLVATNAAEEGLDVPCCEFVVRFTPPASGIQMVQGRGRARKLGAHYMCLMQDLAPGSLPHGGDDGKLHDKSKSEEQHLRKILRKYAVSPAGVQ